MGIIYALKSFFSGSQPKLNLKEHQIKISAMKLNQKIKLKQSNLQKAALKRQQQYIQLMNGPSHMRGMQAERVYLTDQVQNSYRFTALQQINRLVLVIKTQAKTLEQDSRKISNQCFKAVCSIVYCYKELELNQMIQLSQFIPKPYPQISSSKLTPPLLQFIKKKKPTYYQLNLYVLQMLGRNKSLTLQTVNRSGFQFELNPKKPEKQSGSSMMFAMQQISQQEMMQMQNQQPKLGQFNAQGNKNFKYEANQYPQTQVNNDDDDFAC